MKSAGKIVTKAIQLTKEDLFLMKMEIFFIMSVTLWILVKAGN